MRNRIIRRFPSLIASIPAFLGLVAPSLGDDARPLALDPVPATQVRIEDAFWSPKLETWRTVTLNDCFAKFERDGTLENFDKVRDGKGEHRQAPWFDGLLYEMIRAASDFLAVRQDPALEARLDGYIDRIAAAAAKDPDGYINTYTQLAEPGHRWGANGGNDRWQHDLYNAAALVEAGVHHYQATGKTKLLEVAVRLANHMADVMGPPPRRNLVPGHALGERTLTDLYQFFRARPELKRRLSVPVDERRYLDLARFWIDARGNHEGRPDTGAYNQDHLPVVRQRTLEGHAVRAILLCDGLAAAGRAADQAEYLTAARRLWENLTERRMYLTGGAGAVAQDEKFGDDWFLPNNGYAETCAAAAAAFFHHGMNLACGDATYADELERVLYNGLLSGIGETGDRYFYENPLEADARHRRWDWHPCPCCPPMFLKVAGALPGTIFAKSPDGVFVNLYIGSRADVEINGTRVQLRLETRYPWDGGVRLTVQPARPADFGVNLRLPGWCADPEIRVNGQPLGDFRRMRGYASIRREWKPDDTVELHLPMPVRRVYSHPNVAANRGCVALQRGPLVYCLEGIDNGGTLRNLVIPPEAKLTPGNPDDDPRGLCVIRGEAIALQSVDWKQDLYRSGTSVPGASRAVFTAIPFFAQANREPTEMRVWMPESPHLASPLPPPSPASLAKPTASHCFASDTTAALNDRVDPTASDDARVPRFTWWDHRGTTEWVQYDFGKPETVSSVEVYWWDERRIGAHCRVPASWRLLYQEAETWKPVAADAIWKPVPGADAFGTEMDRFNRTEFSPVRAKALRIEVRLQPEWSGGILEWRVGTGGKPQQR